MEGARAPYRFASYAYLAFCPGSQGSSNTDHHKVPAEKAFDASFQKQRLLIAATVDSSDGRSPRLVLHVASLHAKRWFHLRHLDCAVGSDVRQRDAAFMLSGRNGQKRRRMFERTNLGLMHLAAPAAAGRRSTACVATLEVNQLPHSLVGSGQGSNRVFPGTIPTRTDKTESTTAPYQDERQGTGTRPLDCRFEPLSLCQGPYQ